MKSTLIACLIALVAGYLWHLGQIRQLTERHALERAADKTLFNTRYDTLQSDYEAVLAERDQLAKEAADLAANLKAARNQPTANSPQPTVPSAPTAPAAASVSQPAPPVPGVVPAVDPAAEAAALRVRRAALESQIAIARQTVRDWQKKARLEEEAWATQRTGLRLSEPERQKRREEINAAITAKQSELDRLLQQLAALPR